MGPDGAHATIPQGGLLQLPNQVTSLRYTLLHGNLSFIEHAMAYLLLSD